MGRPEPEQAVKPGLYEARSLINDSTAFVVLADVDRLREARMAKALRLIWNTPRSQWVKQTAAWGLGDMGED